MTWTADRKSAQAIGRAMKRQDVRTFLRKNIPEGTRLIPASPDDNLSELSQFFTDGYGAIVCAQPDESGSVVVDIVVVKPRDTTQPTVSQRVPNGTIGGVLATLDKLDRNLLTRSSADRMQFTLAA